MTSCACTEDLYFLPMYCTIPTKVAAPPVTIHTNIPVGRRPNLSERKQAMIG